MTWQPGQRALTVQDLQEWQRWRKDRKREQQRARRAANPRIDYYPDAQALEAIQGLCSNSAGGDYSSAINGIVFEWAAWCHRNKVRRSTDLTQCKKNDA